MKRVDIEDQNQIDQIIQSAKECHLAMIDTEGFPYGVTMNFAYQDGTFYFHSAQTGQKMDALRNNPRVCISLNKTGNLMAQHPDVACSYSFAFESVVAFGLVEFIVDYDEKIQVLNQIMHHYTSRTFSYNAPAVSNVAVWKVKVEKVTARSRK